MDKPKVVVEWHGDHVMMKLKKVSKEAIKAIALETEAKAKVNIDKPFQHADGSYRGQVDTGAMLNSTRAQFSGIEGAGPGGGSRGRGAV